MTVEEYLRLNGVPCQPTLRYAVWKDIPVYGVPILNARGHVDFLLPIVPHVIPPRIFEQWYRYLAFRDLHIWPCGAKAFIAMFQVIK